MNKVNTHPTEDETNELIKQRNSFISIKADIAEQILPHKKQLIIENAINTRNTIIVSGALATAGLLVLNSNSILLSSISNLLLQFSVVSFLITILSFSFYLGRSLKEGWDAFSALQKYSLSAPTKGHKITTDRLNGVITKEEAGRELLKVSKQIEEEQLGRTEPHKVPKEKTFWSTFAANTGNYAYFFAVLFFVVAILFSLLMGVFRTDSNIVPNSHYFDSSFLRPHHIFR